MTTVDDPADVHTPSVRLRALGTTAVLVVSRFDALYAGKRILLSELAAIDRACSRFRTDSEIWAVQRAKGQPVRVSDTLFDALAVACDVAEWTGGAVDPTVGSAIERLGYDRDFAQLPAVGSTISGTATPAPGWWSIELDRRHRAVRIPDGVHVDLGATAKALAADRAVDRIASVTGSGALVGIGGDVSVAGEAPAGGWPIGIATSSSTPVDAVTCTVSVTEGGLATSSTVVRTWRRGERQLHHIVDPTTGEPASAHWRLVSVTGASCVDANAMSTASIVWGARALDRLGALGIPARLVDHTGRVTTLGGWPDDDRWMARMHDGRKDALVP